MKIIGLGEIEAFKNSHAEVRRQISAWVDEVEEAKWLSSSEVKCRYPSCSFLPNNQIVFNLKGNKFRLLVKINYVNQIILIKKLGTHTEYSTWVIN